MATLEEKLLTLLERIEDKQYGDAALASISDLPRKIAQDIDSSPEEAMALLGYLLRNSYVEITTAGIAVCAGKSLEIQLLKKGMKRSG
jgi:hypothetical protein